MLNSSINPAIAAVTERIIERSRPTRAAYLQRLAQDRDSGVRRQRLGCANLAHSFAACSPLDQKAGLAGEALSIGIVTAYNDMLSAHQPYERFPPLIREAARKVGAIAQVAGGVPAMCDGVTQGEAGMELSLFSRDVIALSTAVALSHQTFDAALFLGICDKIVPGLVMGALAFGHLPAIFVPSGPMTSGASNDAKAQVRRDYAAGKVGRRELLESESKSYHGPGTCTFYGTANTNQMLMEIMGLHLPGASFVTPNSELRDALTAAATERVLQNTAASSGYCPIGLVLDERAFVNGIVGLNATGGSTNLTIHLIAMAAVAGIRLDWQDFADISRVVPLLCKVYPNGKADINGFHAAGGMGLLIRELLTAKFLHGDAKTVWGNSLVDYCSEPLIDSGKLVWREAATESLDETIIRSHNNPFQASGGLELLQGNLGRAIVKVSALSPEQQSVTAKARVFASQEAVQAAFKAGELNHDLVVVVQFQGPAANGMPELHNLMPPLGVLQERGYSVALVTDGRLSGASGKVLAAIHVTPEATLADSPIARIVDGDLIQVCGKTARLNILDATSLQPIPAATLAQRAPVVADLAAHQQGVGRNLFTGFRKSVGAADKGASQFAL